MTRSKFNIVRDIVAGKPWTSVRPREFFISWSGVATLAYTGFSGTLLGIKAELEKALPGLRKENPGSLWPKTTLGCLQADRTLSLEDAWKLRHICDSLKPELDAAGPVRIDQLSVVVFHCRSLERRLITVAIPLAGGAAMPEEDAPPRAHLNQVNETMEQFSAGRLADYLPMLRKDGGREPHYRYPHIEATLVFDLGGQRLPPIEKFIAAVDEKIPNTYCWFDRSSLHLTIRALAS